MCMFLFMKFLSIYSISGLLLEHSRWIKNGKSRRRMELLSWMMTVLMSGCRCGDDHGCYHQNKICTFRDL